MHRAAVLIVSVAIALAACGPEGAPASPIDGHPATLGGTSWIVTSIGGVSPAPGAQPTMAFDATRVQGSGGCNHYGGSYRYEPSTGEIRFADLGMTAMACAEPARNATETRFSTAIGQPFLVATLGPDGRLVLTSPAGARLDLDVVGPTVTD